MFKWDRLIRRGKTNKNLINRAFESEWQGKSPQTEYSSTDWSITKSEKSGKNMTGNEKAE